MEKIEPGCHNCIFWRTAVEDDEEQDQTDWGFCHRNAPTINYEVNRDYCLGNDFVQFEEGETEWVIEEGKEYRPDEHFIRRGIFPLTHDDCWCGEYRPKD